MEIRRYLDILNRQKWFIAQAVVLVGLVAVIVSALRTPVYGATARVLLRPDDPSERVKPDESGGASVMYPDRYAAGQKDVVESDAVAQEAAKSLRGLSAAEVKASTSVSVSSTSDVLEISARHGDPVRARDTANAVANGYIENRRLSAVAGLERAINDIGARLPRIQARIAELDARIGGGPAPSSPPAPAAPPATPEPPEDPTAADQPAGLDDPDFDVGGVPTSSESLKAARFAAATQYQTLYSRLQELLVEVRLKRGGAELISPAGTPGAPLSPKPKRDGALGATVGLLLGLGISFVREHLDDRIYSTSDVERTTGLPVLGEIPFDPESVKGDELAVVRRPRSQVAEAVRSLRASLQFLQGDQQARFIVVTSSGPEEGKSFVAANLAAACALDGYRTVLVSADLRRPRLETMFPEAAPSDGLTGLLAQVSPNGPTDAPEPSFAAMADTPVDGTASATRALVTTSVPGLLLLPAGATPLNPAELLNSRKMSQVLAEVTRHPDLVIVDTPPLSAVTDAAILAAQADGVLLVAAVGEARRDATRRSRVILEATHTRLLGVVANKVHPGRGYYGRSGDSYDEVDPKPGRRRQRTRAAPAIG